MKITSKVASMVCVAFLSCGTASALDYDYASDFIDFEAPTVEGGVAKVEGGNVAYVTTPTNTVRFGFGLGSTAIPLAAQEDTDLEVGFTNGHIDDRPAGVHEGEWSLGGHPSQDADNPEIPWKITFDRRVTTVTFDLYDFRSDGSPVFANPGVDQVTLRAYDGGAFVQAGNTFVVSDPPPEDGNVVSFSVTYAGGFDMVVLELDAGWYDAWSAIDNVGFRTKVPEPISLGLAGFGFGLLGLMFLSGRGRS